MKRAIKIFNRFLAITSSFGQKLSHQFQRLLLLFIVSSYKKKKRTRGSAVLTRGEGNQAVAKLHVYHVYAATYIRMYSFPSCISSKRWAVCQLCTIKLLCDTRYPNATLLFFLAVKKRFPKPVSYASTTVRSSLNFFPVLPVHKFNRNQKIDKVYLHFSVFLNALLECTCIIPSLLKFNQNLNSILSNVYSRIITKPKKRKKNERMNSKNQRFILSSLHPLRYPLVFRYYVRGEKQTKEREREK